MRAHELIAKVAADSIRDFVARDASDDGIARFLLDRLTGAQVAAICRVILADSSLGDACEVKIPRALVDGESLPESIVTDEKTTHFRHAECSKPILILANTNDDQSESLSSIVRIGATEIRSQSQLWVDIASADLGLTPEIQKHWGKALVACQRALEPSLDSFAEYVALTRHKILADGAPLVVALGWALPVLKLPRDSGYFDSLQEKFRGQVSKWQALYEQADSKRRCLLCKETPSRKTIDSSDLQSIFESIKDSIPPERHQLIDAFINSEPGWTNQSRELAECEWEVDSINLLFTGLNTRKLNLVDDTLRVFADEYPDTLSAADRQYLESLRGRKSKEASDEDLEFYEKYRNELEFDKSLRSKWDRLVYGHPIECTDFLTGLIQAIERLRDQLEPVQSGCELHIRTNRGKQKSKWKELNSDVGCYFSTRYRGLPALLGPRVTWDSGYLFEFPEFLKEQQERSKNKKKVGKKDRNTSHSKAATELKFFIELRPLDRRASAVQTQLIWRCSPVAVGMELRRDLLRLFKGGTLRKMAVHRELASRKGRLQGLELSDVTSLAAAFGQDKGTLVGRADSSQDISRSFKIEVKEAISAKRLLIEGADRIRECFDDFSAAYDQAIRDFVTGAGISSPSLIWQAEKYAALLDCLLSNAPGDTNREKLVEPVLGVGCAEVLGGATASIVTPWNPLRLAAIAVKARQVAGLIRHILESESVDFGDSRVFFSDLRDELMHPYYPEVCIGHKGKMPELLTVSTTLNDYSLMERPVRDKSTASFNDDPRASAELIGALVQRYLELVPHEKTNLSLALYNCDSIRLPQAVVSHLAGVLDSEDDARCQVILRHSDPSALAVLYQQLLETSDSNPEALIQSELSKDFIARLRLGVRTEPIPTAEEGASKFTDIVFLQDAVSRLAREDWEPAQLVDVEPDLLEHVPARWSYRKPSVRDDLKSTVYLVCPCQPRIGRSYLQSVYSVLDGKNSSPEVLMLPSRHISFQNDVTQQIIKDVHELGEWVANVDDLLERRQLSNQNIRVIKYQQNRAGKPSLIVSSTSSTSILRVLVKRRLLSLNLGLSDSELVALAERFIAEANELSGDIVLRAAKNGVFASELIGVCLSKFLLRAELVSDAPQGWYFLDDYANWLGQKEGRIADIMVLVPQFSTDCPGLTIAISESKYVDASSLADARRNSQKQLRETVDRIYSALFLTPGRLDRDLWLSRFGDLLLTGLDVSPTQDIKIEKFRSELRSGLIPIEIRGYSHVFVSGPSDSRVDSERESIAKAAGCFQEVYGREEVRQLVLAYHSGRSVLDVRRALGSAPLVPSATLPAARVNWTFDGDISPSSAPLFLDTASEIDDLEEDEEWNVSPDAEVPELDSMALAARSADSIVDVPRRETVSQLEYGIQTLAGAGAVEPCLSAWLAAATDSVPESVDEGWLNEVVSRLSAALRSYDLQCKVLGQRLTPNAALIRLKGSDRLGVDDIEKRASRLLTTHGLNVINVSGQPGEILVSIARPRREMVSLRSIWSRRRLNRCSSGLNLSFVVGVKEADGEILYLNLGSEFEGQQQHAPHTLIAGATGSGKSVLLQNLLLDICATNDSTLAHVYLIDPKAGVDYAQLESLPNLVRGIIIEQTVATEVLEYLIAEMDRRYLLFRQNKVKDLAGFNSRVAAAERLPALFLVHDEFAEWMLVDDYKTAVSAAVQRLGVKARAAGIYLIFAAQRPDANVLPVQLRDNLGNRLVLRVESVGTSEISLGTKGAERLLGKGHLAARLMGESDLIFAQVPFLLEDETLSLVELISEGIATRRRQ
ncbi:MAG: DNA translocase FtsK [Candidatus Obscuribacter sp.]|nr:DNA translocase FtsK [Candidatus Obscuribacter sp.]